MIQNPAQKPRAFLHDLEAEHASEIEDRTWKIVSSEKHPCNENEHKCNAAAPRPGEPAIRRVFSKKALTGKHQAMHAAPDDEVPGRTVPQASEKHHDGQVDISSYRSLAIPAQRNVKVVPEPCG